MTSREKVERIIQDVMQWVYFPTWHIMHTARWALEHDDPITCPYAFWSDHQEGIYVFYRDDEYARPFNPLEDMSDAWKIVERLREYPEFVNFEMIYEQSDKPKVSFTFRNAGHDWDNYPYKHFMHKADTAVEAICIAALRAVGALDMQRDNA